MRLYLTVIRNELPAVKTVWPISQPQLKWTISQLVDSINNAFPLETDHWGLEDYIVTLAGFECLHYHEIGAVCQDGDEVIIRPLQTVEVRGRTLSGRNQISAGGKHLLDGVAYGKPALRGPERPVVSIPPPKRKRRRDEEEHEASHPSQKRPKRSIGQQQIVLSAGRRSNATGPADVNGLVEQEEDDDEKSDAEFETGDDEEENSDSSSEEDEQDENSDDEQTADTEEDEDANESTAQSNSSADTNTDTDESSNAESSDTDPSIDLDPDTTETSSSASDSATSWTGIPPSPVKTRSQRRESRKPAIRTDAPQSPSRSQSRRDEASEEITITGKPHAGLKTTQNRNRRRRQAKKLKYLKHLGLLHEDATYDDLAKYEQTDGGEQYEEFEEKRQQLMDALADGGIQITNGGVVASQHPTDDEPPEVQSTKQILTDHNVSADVQPDISLPTQAQRRARLDIASSNRLVFGSLGLRAPRNEAEREALRRKLAIPHNMQAKTVSEKLRDIKQSRIEAIAAVTASRQNPDSLNEQSNLEVKEENDEDWSSKINLRAVECCDEDVTELSAPPFPFKQRWDPQYSKKKRKQRNSAVHVNGYVDNQNGDEESNEKYNGDADYLDYDDVEQEDEPVDDFPPVPDDVTGLPTLDEQAAQENDYVVYKELVCSAETGYQPVWAVRTAQLQSKSSDDDTWIVKIALRDLPKVDYDEDGNQVYGKFDLPRPEEDGAESDERTRTVQWLDLIEPRLLHRHQAD